MTTEHINFDGTRALANAASVNKMTAKNNNKKTGVAMPGQQARPIKQIVRQQETKLEKQSSVEAKLNTIEDGNYDFAKTSLN